VQREVAGDAERLVVDRLDARRLERELPVVSASKKSGWDSLVSTEATLTVPRALAEERSSLISSTPSKSLNSPRTVAMPMCLTAKPALEWDGSTLQEPAGTAVAGVAKVAMTGFFRVGLSPGWPSSSCTHNYSG
jgi:hypothetical protein